MKKLVFTFSITVFTLFLSNGIHGQTTQSQLDEIKLNQRFIGSWQQDVGKDSILIWEVQQHNKAITSTVYTVFGGNKKFFFSQNWSSNQKEGKSKGFNLYRGGGYLTWIGSFTSENKMKASVVRNFNPEEVLRTWEILFESPTSLVVRTYNLNGEKTSEQRWKKIK